MNLEDRLSILESESRNNSEMLKKIYEQIDTKKPVMIAIDVEQASKILGLKPQTIYQRTSAKFITENPLVPVIPHHKFGGKLVFYEIELINFIQSN